ncbi:hypothetical protein E1218_21900 [Kribbella turkmenica]|uniref:Uncharacterized protein n=1 Tax=Kribbella turkmenica TaxID=2530375 RepID=A0A4R4WTF6_9ACTN|nr:hypothetical protein [Kribbella turkmenica]TDD20875.1 hypothetical protein E1218_21900 [Kribbella turkmenica]
MRPRPALLTVLGSLAAAALAATSAVAAVPPSADEPARTVAAPLATDTDGDSLPDTWETNGYDANGDGTVDVDLPAMGASPTKKDLFVEMDYMAGRLTSTAALDRIVQVFAGAPVSNPDGTTGIKLHLDAGAAGGAAYDLGGGNQVPYDNNLQPSGAQTTRIKNANFASARKAVFHYMLWADSYDGGCSSGQAFAIPNDTFIVTVGPKCGWAGTDDQEVGTFIHELGHNLGLRHGGTDHGNYKPNYLSVMNYFFQLGGVIRANGSLYWGYSNVAPAALNEASLRESAGLGSSASGFRTKWKCPNGTIRTTSGAASNPIDWNCDGDATDTTAADVNDDNATTTLTAQNNWANIVFGGGAVGQGANLQSKTAPSELREMTHSEYVELDHSHR